jgi:hypothetical protein
MLPAKETGKSASFFWGVFGSQSICYTGFVWSRHRLHPAAVREGRSMAADYYSILGVQRDASRAEIQRAYRELARRHHPDANRGDPQATKKFVQIEDAYEMLCEPERRRPKGAYHTVGSAFLTVRCMRRPYPQHDGTTDSGFVLPLVSMATIFLLVLVCACVLLMGDTGSAGNLPRGETADTGVSSCSPQQVVVVFLSLIVLAYLAFVVLVIRESRPR